MRVRLILPALMVAALVALTGCHSDMTAARADTAKKAATAAVPAALSFTGTTLDGKKFDGASMAGKPVVLWFWAPWCATCAGEAASVHDLADKYHGQVDVLGVAGMGPEKDMHQFVSDEEVGNIPHLSDNAGVVWKRFGITQQSLYVLIDRAGKVVAKGYMDDLQLTQAFAKIATV